MGAGGVFHWGVVTADYAPSAHRNEGQLKTLGVCAEGPPCRISPSGSTDGVYTQHGDRHRRTSSPVQTAVAKAVAHMRFRPHHVGGTAQKAEPRRIGSPSFVRGATAALDLEALRACCGLSGGRPADTTATVRLARLRRLPSNLADPLRSPTSRRPRASLYR